MISHRQKPATPWPLIVLFIVISASSILLGYLYYKSQKKRLLNDKSLELSAIADLKVKQIAQWRNERISDAVLIGENTPFLKLLSEYLHGTNDKILVDFWGSSTQIHWPGECLHPPSRPLENQETGLKN